MRLLPPEPSPGDKVTAELVRELIRCIRERQIIKGSGYSISSNANGTVIKFGPESPKKTSAEPLPYEVRWDSTLNSGSGGWKIYLPTDHLLSYDGDDIATADIGGATVIKDANNQDTPWYLLDDISSSDDHVWLVLTIDESNGTVDAEFAAAEGQAATGEKVVNVCIAELDYNSGPPVTITINQSVVGALHLGSAADVTLVGNDSTPGSQAKVRPQIVFSNAQNQNGQDIANVSIAVEEDAQDSNVTHVKIGVFYV